MAVLHATAGPNRCFIESVHGDIPGAEPRWPIDIWMIRETSVRNDHGASGESAPPEVSALLAGEAHSFDTRLRAETSPVGVAPQPGMGKKMSAAMLLLGLGLLWPVPLAGALVLVSAALGLAVSSEAELIQTTAVTTNPALRLRSTVEPAPSST